MSDVCKGVTSSCNDVGKNVRPGVFPHFCSFLLICARFCSCLLDCATFELI